MMATRLRELAALVHGALLQRTAALLSNSNSNLLVQHVVPLPTLLAARDSRAGIRRGPPAAQQPPSKRPHFASEDGSPFLTTQMDMNRHRARKTSSARTRTTAAMRSPWLSTTTRTRRTRMMSRTLRGRMSSRATAGSAHAEPTGRRMMQEAPLPQPRRSAAGNSKRIHRCG